MRRFQRVQCRVSSVQRQGPISPRAARLPTLHSRPSLSNQQPTTSNRQRATSDQKLANSNQQLSRRGTTLTEVLMAILVMSVGILAVMSLFPIAFLRSAQGTQLTNAAILKERVEALVDLHGLTSDTLIPQPIEGNVTRCVVDPLGFVDLNNPQRFQYGITDNTLTPFQAAPTPKLIRLNGSTVIDQPVLRRLSFEGADPGDPYPIVVDRFANRSDALRFVALPDQFDTQFTAIPASLNVTRTQATFDAGTFPTGALNSLNALLGQVTLRVILIDATGERSLIRTPTMFGANTIDWTVPLPTSFATLSEVRVESQDLRYTWMLTVRKRGTPGGSVTEADCVVFLNRPSGDPEEELVHRVVFPSTGFPTEDIGYIAVIDFTPYSDATLTAPLRKGGWIFDPTFAQWYRVQDILAEDADGATIRLDRRPEPIMNAAPGDPFQATTTLVIPRGVVAVLPLDVRRSEGRRL